MAAQVIDPMVAVEEQPETNLEGLVRALVGCITRQIATETGQSAPGCDESSEEVLMDVEVDGGRYLLVRMPRPKRAAVPLSPREQEIVRMVAQGHSNKIIADVLNISAFTVCTHLRRIFAKMGVGSRAAMVARSLESAVGIARKPELVKKAVAVANGSSRAAQANRAPLPNSPSPAMRSR